jgi:hypothetical protein
MDAIASHLTEIGTEEWFVVVKTRTVIIRQRCAKRSGLLFARKASIAADAFIQAIFYMALMRKNACFSD